MENTQNTTPAAAPAQETAPAAAAAPTTSAAPAAAATTTTTTSSAPAREHREHRSSDRPDRDQRPQRPQRGRKGRKKVCSFCVDRIYDIDYKDVPRLRRYLSERSKIIPRRVTGTCAHHQRQLTRAIKRARHIALLPFVSE